MAFLVFSGLATGDPGVYFRALKIGEASKGRAGDKLNLLLGGGLCIPVSSRATVGPGVAWNFDGWMGFWFLALKKKPRQAHPAWPA